MNPDVQFIVLHTLPFFFSTRPNRPGNKTFSPPDKVKPARHRIWLCLVAACHRYREASALSTFVNETVPFIVAKNVSFVTSRLKP